MTICLAIDGHDGSGKTTLARSLAETLGAAYVRPFSGVRGSRFLSEAEAGHYAGAIRIASEAVQETLSAFGPHDIVVCDRLWITVLSVLPVGSYGAWTFRPPTLLCWSDLGTTLARLGGRRERQKAVAWHKTYLTRYFDIAGRFGVEVLRTDHLGIEASFEVALGWARLQSARGSTEVLLPGQGASDTISSDAIVSKDFVRRSGEIN